MEKILRSVMSLPSPIHPLIVNTEQQPTDAYICSQSLHVDALENQRYGMATNEALSL